MNELNFIQPKKTVGKLISADVLDKIRAEIEQMIEYHDCPVEYDNGNDYWYCQALNTALQIIDKYRKEQTDAGTKGIV